MSTIRGKDDMIEVGLFLALLLEVAKTPIWTKRVVFWTYIRTYVRVCMCVCVQISYSSCNLSFYTTCSQCISSSAHLTSWKRDECVCVIGLDIEAEEGERGAKCTR